MVVTAFVLTVISAGASLETFSIGTEGGFWLSIDVEVDPRERSSLLVMVVVTIGVVADTPQRGARAGSAGVTRFLGTTSFPASLVACATDRPLVTIMAGTCVVDLLIVADEKAVGTPPCCGVAAMAELVLFADVSLDRTLLRVVAPSSTVVSPGNFCGECKYGREE